MENIEIRLLEGISFKEVYEAFMESFSDYEVPMQMTIGQFQEMVVTRDIDFNYSVGCFSDEKLIGFIICGYREIEGKKYCYDGGTGIIPDFRRKGIANKLFTYLVDLLKKKSIEVFLLEVLENNIPAIELYLKNGFITQRRLECFQIKKNEISDYFSKDYILKSDKAEYFELDDTSFYPSLASWQNERLSILNNIDNYEYCSLSCNQQIVAFGFVNKKRGDIPQLRVLRGWENKQLEMFLISELKNRTESEVIKFVTLDENSSLIDILSTTGFSNFVNLYEMTLRLH
ncbi:GNAT family N-acetyltransferase [Dysgonomonas sp. HDW5A]|uniref:GNAT family N-acetyltransferase n=1 Tax=Dysgonomonas sp. HDW5A TaxID=2714926 RepID=UPI00140B836D|nr:GNAT family N-acetyltransferase [Dysgonomonas sp. HDW5A]QIK61444.1 GNAT family N-acetyltransferase [Dysgonomonas sp. HDW5A]